MLTEETFSVARRRLSWKLSLLWVTLGALSLLAISGPVLVASQNSPDAPTRPTVIEPKAQALLDMTLQALGGASFLGFKSLTTSGRAFTISDDQTAGFAPFTSAVVYPDKRHFSYGKKKPVTIINNGDQGWELDKYGTISQKPVDLLRWKTINRYSLENLLRVRIHEPGMLIQDGGTDFVDQLPARVLTMVDARQVQIRLFISNSNFLPIRITYRMQNATGDDWDEYADVYGDYQKIQGSQTPMHITRFLNDDRESETYRNTAKYDESYPADYFVIDKK
jgi:hypothetical protein